MFASDQIWSSLVLKAGQLNDPTAVGLLKTGVWYCELVTVEKKSLPTVNKRINVLLI